MEVNVQFLQREQMKDLSGPVAGAASALLAAIVDAGTNILWRCQLIAEDHIELEDARLAPLALYRHILVHTHALEVLLSQAIGQASAPSLRSAWEAGLGIEYIAQRDSTNRALAWMISDAMEAIQRDEQMKPGNAAYDDFVGRCQDEGWPASLVESCYLPREEKAHLHGAMEASHFTKLRERWVELYQGNGKRPPKWYALPDGGPGSVRKLASVLGRTIEYELLYANWSSSVHAADPAAHIVTRPPGSPAYLTPLRSAKSIWLSAHLACSVWERATAQMMKLHPGEWKHVIEWAQKELPILKAGLTNA